MRLNPVRAETQNKTIRFYRESKTSGSTVIFSECGQSDLSQIYLNIPG